MPQQHSSQKQKGLQNERTGEKLRMCATQCNLVQVRGHAASDWAPHTPPCVQASSSASPAAAAAQTPARRRPSQGELVEAALGRLPSRHPLVEIGVNLMDASFDKVWTVAHTCGWCGA